MWVARGIMMPLRSDWTCFWWLCVAFLSGRAGSKGQKNKWRRMKRRAWEEWEREGESDIRASESRKPKERGRKSQKSQRWPRSDSIEMARWITTGKSPLTLRKSICYPRVNRSEQTFFSQQKLPNKQGEGYWKERDDSEPMQLIFPEYLLCAQVQVMAGLYPVDQAGIINVFLERETEAQRS